MKSFVSELASPSGLDRQVGLDEASVQKFRATFEALDVVPASNVTRDTCWACKRDGQQEHDFVIMLGPGADGLIYVVPPFAMRGTEVRRINQELHALLVSLIAAAPMPMIARSADIFRCDHPDHVPFLRRCACGSPDDFTQWSSSDVCLFSNCFNFAVRDVWCTDGYGAQPAAVPDPIDDQEEWARVLGPDGLYHVPDFPRVPSVVVTATGWHVALAVKADSDAPYHFLRLDGDRWTHKFGKRPPQTCDSLGRPMPKTALGEADLCGYKVLTHFWVPGPLRINH